MNHDDLSSRQKEILGKIQDLKEEIMWLGDDSSNFIKGMILSSRITLLWKEFFKC